MAKSRKASRKSSRKGTRKSGSDWSKKVMAVYKELKAKNKNTRLGDAMREASARKKRGTL
jgi:hypothetical protein